MPVSSLTYLWRISSRWCALFINSAGIRLECADLFFALADRRIHSSRKLSSFLSLFMSSFTDLCVSISRSTSVYVLALKLSTRWLFAFKFTDFLPFSFSNETDSHGFRKRQNSNRQLCQELRRRYQSFQTYHHDRFRPRFLSFVFSLHRLTLLSITGVPAVWELIRKGILAKVQAGGSVKSSIFYGALTAKSWTKKLPIVGSVVGAVTDKVVFNQVKAATGGNLTYAVNGGESEISFLSLENFVVAKLSPLFFRDVWRYSFSP